MRPGEDTRATAEVVVAGSGPAAVSDRYSDCRGPSLVRAGGDVLRGFATGAVADVSPANPEGVTAEPLPGDSPLARSSLRAPGATNGRTASVSTGEAVDGAFTVTSPLA